MVYSGLLKVSAAIFHVDFVYLLLKSEFNNVFQENQCILRDRENYSSCLEKNDSSITRIKEECIFHVLKNVHVTEIVALDIMHDLWSDQGLYS